MTNVPRRRAVREVIPHDPVTSFRFYVHAEPHPYAGWHYHPEYELHLIARSGGSYVIGDAVGGYAPGQLVLLGPDLPHHWIADPDTDAPLEDAHVVLHFTEEWIRGCQAAAPELGALDPLLQRASRGIEFAGVTAARGTAALLAVRDAASPLDRVVRVLDTLRVLAEGPDQDHQLLLFGPPLNVPGNGSAPIGRAIDYILSNLSGEVRLDEAAALAAMSPSAFSRTFKAGSGQTFTDLVRRLRLTQACRLLETTADPVATIAGAVGYANLSNFNRQFLRAYGHTPRDHRAGARSTTTAARQAT